MTDFTQMSDQTVESLYESNAAAISGSFTYIAEHLRRELLKQVMTTNDEKVSELKTKYKYLSELETLFNNFTTNKQEEPVEGDL